VTGTRAGVAFIVAGLILIVLGTLEVGRDDLMHTVATSMIVFGAVVISVATEGKDQASD